MGAGSRLNVRGGWVSIWMTWLRGGGGDGWVLEVSKGDEKRVKGMDVKFLE